MPISAGRHRYQIMGPYWAASEGPIANAMNEKPKAVFSHTLKTADWGPAEIFGGDLVGRAPDVDHSRCGAGFQRRFQGRIARG